MKVLIFFSLMILVDVCTTNTPLDPDYQELPDLKEITISEVQKYYRDGIYTVEEVTLYYLDRIQQLDDQGPHLNAVLETNPEALQIARSLDQKLKAGQPLGRLFGVPVILKDNIDTRDKMSTTAGSRAMEGSKPLQDSYIVERLRAEDAIILGKANLSEWANFRGRLSSSGWSGLGGQTRNPYDTTRNPCGSSSGSAVAVSANLCLVAIGTETNGSIVCPSTANGIVGLKPTVGLWSRSGIIPISKTQDTPGPMTRSVADAAITLGACTGLDERDPYTEDGYENAVEDYSQFLNKDGLQGKRIGLFKGTYGEHYKVDTLLDRAVEDMKALGAEFVEIENIAMSNAWPASLEVMLYEYKDGLNKYFKSLGPNAPITSIEELIAFNKSDSIELRHYDQYYLKEAIKKGDLSDTAYQKALKEMHRIMRKEGIDRIMDEHKLDAIVGATGSPAWKTDLINGDHYMLSTSSPAAMAGYPNLTVPMGYIDGLPVGISFFGRAWSEGTLIELAYAYEQETAHRKAPGL
ncbi:MAG: amidase [Saprospiraceae bacterium]|nr:amidase [Saprospiraceae bacterium]